MRARGAGGELLHHVWAEEHMDKLGIEPKLLLAQLINFFVILVVLQKLLYKPILDMIAKRKKEIEEGLGITEKMRVAEEKQKEKEEKALAKAREDALKIIEDAKKQAKEVEKDLVADAHVQATAIIARAKDEAQEVVKQSQAAVRKQAVDLAVVMAKRLLSSVMSAKEQHALVGKQIKDLEHWSPESK